MQGPGPSFRNSSNAVCPQPCGAIAQTRVDRLENAASFIRSWIGRKDLEGNFVACNNGSSSRENRLSLVSKSHCLWLIAEHGFCRRLLIGRHSSLPRMKSAPSADINCAELCDLKKRQRSCCLLSSLHQHSYPSHST